MGQTHINDSSFAAWRGISWPVRGLLALSLLLPALMSAWFAWQQRAAVLAEAEWDAQRSLAALVEHTAKVVEVQSLVINQVGLLIRGRPLAGLGGDAPLQKKLADLAARFEQVEAIGIVDADGRLLLNSARTLTGTVSVTDRDYFAALKTAPAQGLFFGRVVTGKVIGTRVFPVAQALTDESGRFAGLVFVAVRAEYLYRFWQQFAPGKEFLIPLLREDGHFLMRYPMTEPPERLPPDAFFMRTLREETKGVLRGRSQVDGIERVTAYSRIKDYPLYIAFGIDKEVVLDKWRHELLPLFAMAALATAAMFALLWAVLRHTREQQAAVGRWRAAAEALDGEMKRREQAEALAKAERDRLQMTIGSLPLVVWTAGADGRVDYLSPQVTDFTGLPPESLLGDSWVSIMDPRDGPAMLAAWQAALGSGEPFAYEFRLLRADGVGRWFSSRAVAQRDEHGRIVKWFGSAVDIHDLRQAEEALIAQQAQLEVKVHERTLELEQEVAEHRRTAQQLQEHLDALAASEAALVAAKADAERANDAKSRFLAAASHDLRQPLAAMTLYLDVLKHEAASGSQPLVANLQDCVASLSGLLGDLLDMSKLDAGVVTPTIAEFPIQEMLDSLLSIHLPEARLKGLRLDCVPSRLSARTDPVLFQRMLGNLLANAIRYTERGRVLVGCRRRAGRVWVEVWDTGVGIPEDKLGEVFEEFKQLGDGSRRRGSGLGLAIVAKTARLLGLQIRTRSWLGRGSVFALEMPLGRAPLREAPESHAEQRALRIALVEDNPAVRLALACALESVGHEVVAAESGPRLFESLGGQRPDFVLSDYRLMDGETGLDVIDAVRERYGEDVPALIMTGETTPGFMRSMAERGVTVQHKPIDLDALQACMASLLGAADDTDALTGLWRPARFEQAARKAVDSARRCGQATSLILLRVDRAREIADAFGEQVRDDVVLEIVRRVGASLRRSDSLGRWGDDELIVLASETPAAGAAALAEKLRRVVAGEPHAVAGRLGASFGVAEHLAGEPFEECLPRAADALCLATNAGGDCVRLHPAHLPAAPREPVDGKFVQLVWSERYDCGEATIDAQHRSLFERANNLLSDVLARRPAPDVELSARRLLEETMQHFRDEEAILAVVGYPDLEPHRAEHAALLYKAGNLFAALEENRGTVAQVLEFLTYDVIAQHMLGSDQEFARHFRSGAAAACVEAA